MAAIYSRDNSLPPVIEHDWQCLETVWEGATARILVGETWGALNTEEAQAQ